MKKLVVVLGLAGLSVPGKVEKARTIVSKMTDNDYFPAPVPPLSDVSTAADDLETAYKNSRDAGKSQTKIMYEVDDELEVILTNLSHYVRAIAKDREEVVFSAGMEVKRTGKHVKPLLEVRSNDLRGEVKLIRVSEKGAAYIWEIGPDGGSAEDWKQAGVSTLSTFMIPNLESAKAYLFRVAVVKGRDQLPWSDPVRFVVG